MTSATEKSDEQMNSACGDWTERLAAELLETHRRLAAEAAARTRAENEVRDIRTHTERLLASIPSLLIGIDENDEVLQWNVAATKLFGIAAHEAVGRRLCECKVPWDWAPVLPGITACRVTHESQRLDDVRFTTIEGKEGFLGLTINPVMNEAGEYAGVLVIGADITERRLLQTQLAHAQKLESIGQLAAGIAHEINTPTQFVGDNTRFLKDAFGDLTKLLDAYAQLLEACKGERVTAESIAQAETAVQDAGLDYLTQEIPKAIEQSLEGVARVAKIVRAMKEFSHPGGEEKVPIDVNKAIESTMTVARNEWKYVAEMVTDFDPSLPPVLGLPGDLNQVILNMIVNAAHAIAEVVGNVADGKGMITIATRRDGDWAEIRVSDTGTGIPETVRSRIFEPFFTTKPVGKGTGQGLAIAHSVVVKKHGGALTFETEVGKGTTFIIRLPIQPESTHAEQTVRAPQHE